MTDRITSQPGSATEHLEATHEARRWVDKNTGRVVRQISHPDQPLIYGYFRQAKHLHDGRVIASHERTICAVNTDTGEIQTLTTGKRGLHLRASDGRFLVWDGEGKPYRAATVAELEHAERKRLPEELPGRRADMTCDGRYAILQRIDVHDRDVEHLTDSTVETLWRFFDRGRDGFLWSYDLVEQKVTPLVELHGIAPIHPDASPTDPTLVKFSHDYFDAYCQRIWTVRVDGSDLKPIRVQERGELITHEFWWPDGTMIGYKYQDRRHDETIDRLPWAEYSPIATQFCLANLDGQEVYQSDPLNSYHSHIFVSRDGTLLCGEGTHDHSFVYAARFDQKSTKVDFQPLATIHTPYVAMAGQSVNAGFSADGRWLLYNDTVDGAMHLCAVEVDL